ncbi:MAG: VWA domain-containing protein [Proteobacteria bacterium]|nr:VWA domain-containing protein [Pseudomonadota bacterium]
MTAAEFTQHFYSLIAGAVAGRSVPVHWHDDKKYNAYTDNSCIYVPAFEFSRMHAFDVIAQALLIRVGALKREHVRKLLGKRNIHNRYLFAEIVRATRLNANILPRAFCENAAIRQFPFTTNSPEQSYTLAAGKEHFPAFPDFLGTLRCLLVLNNSLPEQAPAPELKLQKKVTAVLAEDEEEGESEESIILKLLSKKQIFAAKGRVADFIAKLLGITGGGKPQKKPGSGGGVELPMGNVSMVKRKGKLIGRLSDLSVEVVVTKDSNEAGSHIYPEWDCSKQKYRTDWVVVDEVDPLREKAESGAVMSEILQPPSMELKRKLAGVGLSFEKHRNQAEGEDYIIDRVVNYFVDCRSGTTPNEGVYTRNMKTRRDLAAMLLLDISGSTAEMEKPGGFSVHHKQMQLAYHLMTALHGFGDQVSLYAFHSWGRTMVRLVRMKAFKDRFIDSRIRNRFAMLEPVGFTRIGGALRHAARKLQEEETGLPYQILITITDGFSYDHGYEGEYGEEDTKKAIEEIRSKGIGCLCITIGSDQQEEKLKNIFGKASTLAARDYDDFIHNIRPALLRAVAQTRSG